MTENKLICPFCNETELEKGIELQGGGFILGCPKCKKFAHDVFWQELIKAKKRVASLDKIRAANRRYKQRNREKINEYQREWQRKKRSKNKTVGQILKETGMTFE